MPPLRRPSARALARPAPSPSGFDVWLPVLVALAAAIFMLTAASAQTAAPRQIFDPARFDRPSVTPVADPAPVVAIALPALPAAAAAPVPARVAHPVFDRSTNAFHPLRLLAAFGIAGLLMMALSTLGRTWRRLESA